LEQQSADLIRTALSRTGTNPSQTVEDSKKKKDRPDTAKPTAGALAALGFRAAAVAGPTVQPAPPVEEKEKDKRSSKPNKSFLLPSKPVGSSIKGSEEPRPSRSPSPFFRARKAREARRAREKSPEIHALRKDSTAGAESAAESDGEAVRGRRGAFRPQASAYESPDESDDDVSEKEIKLAVPVVATPVPPAATAAAATVAAPVPTPGPEVKQDEISEDEELHAVGDEHDDDDDFGDDEFDDDFFDEQTKENTEANAIYDAPACEPDSPRDKTKQDRFDVYGEEVEQDVLGEGPNVVVPPEPIFSGPTHVRRTTSKKGLELTTSRPAYGRDRCTINITQGDPDGSLDKSGKRMRRYVVLSDLSDESQYAVEWAVGTVARDGDEIFLISVMEDEGKVDPKAWSSKDASTKIKVQKERQTTASLLARQVTGLLSRTRLNITVTCQALHAKNARHMLLDLIDFLEPTMVIVGSRGLGQLKG
jgi:nucleotide-binding universal stress UspA family protein